MATIDSSIICNGDFVMLFSAAKIYKVNTHLKHSSDIQTKGVKSKLEFYAGL